MNDALFAKLAILTEAARYDVSCSSSGVGRRSVHGGIGNAAGWGICHSFADDGRCISLLKVLLSNHCEFDCAYCVNRRSNDVPRAAFTVRELVELTIEFYRRNYIEGLFLSSGIIWGADYTMERMVGVARELRLRHRFNGYIHMKGIPGASRELVRQAGLFADRLSVNIEIPSESNLKLLAPGKDHQSVYLPMRYIRDGVREFREEWRRSRNAPRFAPAGQSTQMIIGASNERDKDILRLASFLYHGPELKRVYYSGFIPVNTGDPRLPTLVRPPLKRENRLYQADWLMRFYQFGADEILTEEHPDLDPDLDPKLAWALRHPDFFPLDLMKAEYWQILRVPGIGLKSAERILEARRYTRLDTGHLKKLGVVMKRARYFIVNLTARPGGRGAEPAFTIHEAGPVYLRNLFSENREQRPKAVQLPLFG